MNEPFRTPYDNALRDNRIILDYRDKELVELTVLDTSRREWERI